MFLFVAGRAAFILKAAVSDSNAFERLIELFEKASLPRAEWTHAAHVGVGTHYVSVDRASAFLRIKHGIMRLNEATGVQNTDTSGYHESLTVLWLAIIAAFVGAAKDPYFAAKLAVERFGGERNLHCLYYSFDVVHDRTARRTWTPPDLSGPFELCSSIVESAASGRSGT